MPLATAHNIFINDKVAGVIAGRDVFFRKRDEREAGWREFLKFCECEKKHMAYV